MPYKPGFKPIGLTLSPDDYQRLKQLAVDRHWSLAMAAQIIIREYLDNLDEPSGLCRGTSRGTGADGP